MTLFKPIKKTEKRLVYTGTGDNIEIEVSFEPILIQGTTQDGNRFLFIKDSGKTWYFSDGEWTSNISKYEITDGGISIDETNHKVIIGDNSYINESGKKYILLIFGDSEGDDD